jgi:ribonuclease P protein component
MKRLKHRADFLAAAAAAKASTKAFVLQLRDRRDDGPPRVGFTVSKKVGNAVVRNRVRRRLREIVRLAATDTTRDGHDYVLIGRRTGLTASFAGLAEDFKSAVRRLHEGRTRQAKPD